MISRDELRRHMKNSVRLTRRDIIELFRRDGGHIPESATFVVVEVEKGDELINVNDVDGLVISWGP